MNYDCKHCPIEVCTCIQTECGAKEYNRMVSDIERLNRLFYEASERNSVLARDLVHEQKEVERLKNRELILRNKLLEEGVIEYAGSINGGDEWICRLCSAVTKTRETIVHADWCIFKDDEIRRAGNGNT